MYTLNTLQFYLSNLSKTEEKETWKNSITIVCIYMNIVSK